MKRREFIVSLIAALFAPPKLLADSKPLMKFESRDVVFTASADTNKIGHVCFLCDDRIITIENGETFTLEAGKDFICEF